MKILLAIKLLLISVIVTNPLVGSSKGIYNSEESQTKPVLVIVNSDIYPQIQESIECYLDDLHNENNDVIFRLWDINEQPNVEDLREYLKEIYVQHNIQGAILVGEIPYAQASLPYVDPRPNDQHREGPLEEYLMDLSSVHFVKNDDNVIINMKGYLHYDIWVSRIWPNAYIFMGPNRKTQEFKWPEHVLINRYFQKNHKYRTCQSPVPNLEISFDADNYTNRKAVWAGDFMMYYLNAFIHAIAEYKLENEDLQLFKEILPLKLYKSGGKKEYLKFIKENPAQLLRLYSHSSPFTHSFKPRDLFKMLMDQDQELKENLLAIELFFKGKIKQPFIALNACSACDFSFNDSLGTVYLFSPKSSALLISGLTLPGFNAFHRISSRKFVSSSSDLNIMTDFTELNEMNTPAMSFGRVSGGLTFLGDPTLIAYKDMDWCIEDEEDNLPDLPVDL